MRSSQALSSVIFIDFRKDRDALDFATRSFAAFCENYIFVQRNLISHDLRPISHLFLINLNIRA